MSALQESEPTHSHKSQAGSQQIMHVDTALGAFLTQYSKQHQLCFQDKNTFGKAGPDGALNAPRSFAFDAHSLRNPFHYSTNVTVLAHCTSHSNNEQFRQHLAPLRDCRQTTNKYDHPSFSQEEIRTHLIPGGYGNKSFK